MRRIILSCIGVVASVGAAAAQPAQPALQAENPVYNIGTLGDLVRVCATDRNDEHYPGAIGLCAGYISGVLDYHLVDTGWSGARKLRRVCMPAQSPTRMEALRSLVSWDRSNPKYDNEPAAEGVMRFYMASYPCHPPRAAGRTSLPHG